jgi:hypothetical protein
VPAVKVIPGGRPVILKDPAAEPKLVMAMAGLEYAEPAHASGKLQAGKAGALATLMVQLCDVVRPVVVSFTVMPRVYEPGAVAVNVKVPPLNEAVAVDGEMFVTVHAVGLPDGDTVYEKVWAWLVFAVAEHPEGQLNVGAVVTVMGQVMAGDDIAPDASLTVTVIDTVVGFVAVIVPVLAPMINGPTFVAVMVYGPGTDVVTTKALEYA